MNADSFQYNRSYKLKRYLANNYKETTEMEFSCKKISVIISVNPWLNNYESFLTNAKTYRHT